MKINKILASMAAAALSVSSFAVMTINASVDEEPTDTVAAADSRLVAADKPAGNEVHPEEQPAAESVAEPAV